jgi:SAM-dependent methyltransferase
MNKEKIKKLKRLRRVLMRLFIFPFVAGDYFRYKRHQKNLIPRFDLRIADSWPFILDKTSTTPFDRHYIYHTGWAARVVRNIDPEFHVDISSSLYFSSIVSAFIPIKFYDYRPAVLELDGYTSGEADLLKLPFETNSIKSLSCMHTVEHVGLGRYGDPLDPDGDIKAINELKRVVSIDGSLIFVVPVGRKVLRFNGLRIYSYEQIIDYFKDMELIEFSLIHEYEEDGGITINATKELVNKEEYGCGCFWFKKNT